MRLYYHPMSSNSRRVAMTVKLLGTPVELVEVDLLDEGARRRLFEINPNGMVPVLEDGDLMLWESCAIMQYLTEQAHEQELYPQDTRARADINRWMFWAAQHFSPAVGVLTWEHAWKGITGGGEADPKEVARGEQDFHKFAAVLDGHVAGRQWIAGKSLSLADIAIAAPLMYIEAGRLPVAGYPNMLAWFERCEALDVWRETEVELLTV